jgi:two-component system, cell cycle sensor histidine kinase and response regulator CckA
MDPELNVLFLEDNPSDALLLLRELERSGMKVRWTRVDTESDFLARLDPDLDLILTDYSMPSFDAPRALDLIRESGLDIPVLVVTGTAVEEVVVECIKRGASDYLLKDRLARLGPAVKAALEGHRVRTRRREAERLFAAQHAVTRTLAEAETLAEAIPRILEALCENLEWDLGLFWTREGNGADSNALHRAGAYHRRETREADERIPSDGLDGLEAIWERGQPAWISDGATDDGLARAAAATRGGFRTHFVFPVLAAGRTVGLVELFGARARQSDAGLVKVAVDLGSQIGQFVARKRGEEALRNERSFLQAVLDTIDVGIVACSAEGVLTLFNRATQDLHGLPQEPLPAEEWAAHYSLFEADGRTPLATDRLPLVRALRGEAVHDQEIVIAPKDGARRRLVASGQQILGARHEVLGAVVAMHDVTDSKRLEEQFHQAQKMEAVGRLAGGIAHDFNNLLTVIKGYGQMALKHVTPDDPIHLFAEEIVSAATRATTLTRQLLTFSRKQVLESKPLDLNELVEGVTSMLRRLIGEDIDLNFRPEPALGVVEADPGHIEQIVVNLAVNARDAMAKGGKLTIETANVTLDDSYAIWHAEVEPGEYVMLAVSDTGVGMDAETLSHIFEPFFTTKGPDKGTGLGLSTVYGIVRQSGGHIWVYSEPGSGTSVKIYLPRVASEIRRSGAEPFSPTPQATGEVILLVEDEASVRELVRLMLVELGYTVLEAKDGADALALASSHERHIDVLMTDVIMPGMSGRELANRLLETRSAMKILYMSGYTDAVIDRHDLLGAGVYYIAKPFGSDTLAAKLRRILGER